MAEEEIDLEDLDEEQQKTRIDLMYQAVEIKYENWSEVFKEKCDEYPIDELFEMMVDEDNLGEDGWENNAVLGEVLAEADDGAFQEIGEEFAQFCYDVLATGKCEATSVSRPNTINWASADDEKKVEEAQIFIDSMCPGAGFNDTSTNINLLKAFAVGRTNYIPVISIFMEMYQLSLINEGIHPNNANKFSDVVEWSKSRCKWPKSYEKTKLKPPPKNDNKPSEVTPISIIENGIKDFVNRLCGSTFTTMIFNKIEDDINIYIDYIMKINNVVSNILESNKQCCPMQIDVVIIGKEHAPKDETKQDEDDDDDDDDDDDANIMSNINASMAMNDTAALANPLPSDGIGKFLTGKDIKLTSEKIIIKDTKTNRKIQDLLSAAINEQREQRIILIIDRTEKNGCKRDEGEDMLYIYQLPKYDKINEKYQQCEEHLSWMTKKQLFPDWKEMNKGDGLDMYKGGGDDIGDRGFVFSFHVHEDKKIKCEQYIKSQKLPFLPHHMIDLWPMYFAKGFDKIDSERFDKSKIYKDWKLEVNDDRLFSWIESIDPVYYKSLKKDHLDFQKK